MSAADFGIVDCGIVSDGAVGGGATGFHAHRTLVTDADAAERDFDMPKAAVP